MQAKSQRRKNQFCLFMEMRIGQSFRRHVSRLDKAKHSFDNDTSIILFRYLPKIVENLCVTMYRYAYSSFIYMS